MKKLTVSMLALAMTVLMAAPAFAQQQRTVKETTSYQVGSTTVTTTVTTTTSGPARPMMAPAPKRHVTHRATTKPIHQVKHHPKQVKKAKPQRVAVRRVTPIRSAQPVLVSRTVTPVSPRR